MNNDTETVRRVREVTDLQAFADAVKTGIADHFLDRFFVRRYTVEEYAEMVRTIEIDAALLQSLLPAKATHPTVEQRQRVRASASTAKGQVTTEREQLATWYAEAIGDENWAAYASEYFQEKHDLAGTLKEHRDRLAGEKP